MLDVTFVYFKHPNQSYEPINTPKIFLCVRNELGTGIFDQTLPPAGVESGLRDYDSTAGGGRENYCLIWSGLTAVNENRFASYTAPTSNGYMDQ